MNSGIYYIRNINNNKIYIGSTQNFKNRFSKHRSQLKNNRHHNILLQNAYNKYGIESFNYIILELCDIDSLLIREQYWLDNLNPEYNISKFADAPTRGRSIKRCPLTQDVKDKISNTLKEYYSDESLRNFMRDINIGNKNRLGKPTSEETKMKFYKKVIVYNIDGSLFGEFKSVLEASINTNIHKSQIARCARGERKDKRFIFIYP